MLSYLIVHRLCRLWQTVELTLEDAMNELSTLCLTDLQIDGKTIMGRIPDPRPTVRKLLGLAKIELPKAVVSLGVSVSTRKNYWRKIRLDFGHATAFSTMLTSFSGKSGMAMMGLSLAGIFSGSSWASRKALRKVSISISAKTSSREHFSLSKIVM